jgi:hypothetical protein
LTGETVALRIQKVSTGAWYDFDDGTFKTSGWTTPTTNLSYDATGEYYYYLFNPPATETAAEQYIFVVDNASADYGDHQSEIVSYQDVGNSNYDYASNQVIVATNNDKTGYSISGAKTTLDSLNDITAVSVWSVSPRTLTSGGYSGLTAADVDAVWDEPLSGHASVGTAGKALSDIETYTNGVKDGEVYNGVESLIRINR